VAYYTAYPATGYAALLANLGGVAPCVPAVATGCLIDDVVATNGGGAGKNGYNYANVGTLSTYVATAVPITLQSTGTRTFCSVEDNVVRFLANSAAVPAYAACQGYAALAN